MNAAELATQVHAAKLLVEGGIVAVFLVFLWIVLPCISGRNRR